MFTCRPRPVNVGSDTYFPNKSVPTTKPVHIDGNAKGQKHNVSMHQCVVYVYEHKAKVAPGCFTIETAQGQEIVHFVTEAIFGHDLFYI